MLAACLGWDELDGANRNLRRQLGAVGPAWPEILDLANRELLAPTLWSRLRGKGFASELPAEAGAYLRRCHAVNTVRNDRIKEQLAGAIRALNGRGIEPVLLKGAVDLFISRYGDSGARVLRDVDIFIRHEDIDKSRAALVGAGYRELPPEPGKFVTYFVEFTRPGAIVPYDVQWFISGQRNVLSPEDAFRQSMVHRDGDLIFRTLSANHQIVHNLLHSELQDRGADLGFVWLRQLLDLAALGRQLGDMIAWDEVQDRLAQAGSPSLLAKRLYMAHQLVGMPMPNSVEPTVGSRMHHRRALAQLRWPWVTRLLRFWATMTSPIDARLLELVYEADPKRPWNPLLKSVTSPGWFTVTGTTFRRSSASVT